LADRAPSGKDDIMENGEDVVAMEQQQHQPQNVDGVQQATDGGVEELHSPTKGATGGDLLQLEDGTERTYRL